MSASDPEPFEHVVRALRPRLPAFVRADRVAWSVRLVAASLLVVKLITPGLWRSERLFPHAPLASWVPALHEPLDTLLLVFEFVLLAGLVLRPRRHAWLPALYAIAAVWIATDQIRLQPWYYLYLLMLAPVALLRRDDRERDPGILLCTQLVVVGLYAWSGLHKHSYDFYHYVHGFIAKPLEPFLPGFLWSFVESLGYAAPWFELAAGLALAFRPTRNLGVWAITLMHAYLLLCLGPLGSGWNEVIWPWNISMVLLVWTLFHDAEPVPWRAAFRRPVGLVAAPVLLLALAMPALRYVDAWDFYLSFCLYSGKERGLTLFVKAPALGKLPPEVQAYFQPTVEPPGLEFVAADTWSMDELGVPVNPQPRIYKAIGKALCERYFGGDELLLMIKRRPRYVTESEIYRCGEL